MLTFVVIVAVFALGSFVQTIAGFGSALVIMPILTQFIGVQTASTVMALVGATVTIAVLHQNRRGFRWGEAKKLLVGAVVGVPIGTWALKTLPAAPVVAILGATLLVYGMYSLFGGKNEERPAVISGRVGSGLVGFCAGLLGGAYATDGPPLIVYGFAKRWEKESFRSILQACFLVDGILIILCHQAGGLVTGDVLKYCLYGIPGMAAGLAAGMVMDRRINHALFHRMLLWLITALGAALLVRAYYGA